MESTVVTASEESNNKHEDEYKHMLDDEDEFFMELDY